MEKISRRCVETGCECLKPPPDRYLRLEDDEYCERPESSMGSSFSDGENSGDNPMRKRTEFISVESDDDYDDEISSQKMKKNRTEERSGCAGNTFVYSFGDDEEEGLYDESDTTYAQPLIRCAWTGSFDVHYDESIYHRRVYSFNACLSTKTCKQVCVVAADLEPVLYFEMLPQSCLWPKSFGGWGPTGDDIALYFFPPSMKHEKLYDSLVAEMIHYNLGMRASVQESELLIFTSDELPLRFRRFQGKFYLWGVFRSEHK